MDDEEEEVQYSMNGEREREGGLAPRLRRNFFPSLNSRYVTQATPAIVAPPLTLPAALVPSQP